MTRIDKYELWQPGDGLHCTFEGRSRRQACGRPVVVRFKVPGNHPGKARRQVLCSLHILERSIGVLGAEAEREAREEILAAHYDEYRTLLQHKINEKVEAEVSALPVELQAIARKALAEDGTP